MQKNTGGTRFRSKYRIKSKIVRIIGRFSSSFISNYLNLMKSRKNRVFSGEIDSKDGLNTVTRKMYLFPYLINFLSGNMIKRIYDIYDITKFCRTKTKL